MNFNFFFFFAKLFFFKHLWTQTSMLIWLIKKKKRRIYVITRSKVRRSLWFPFRRLTTLIYVFYILLLAMDSIY